MFIAIVSKHYCYLESLIDNPKTSRSKFYRQQRVHFLQAQLYERAVSEECTLWLCQTKAELDYYAEGKLKINDLNEFINKVREDIQNE